jgi:hypothetical protein
MGRLSHELGYVMPDQKAVYMSDDGSNVGLFRFVAEEPGKLDKGRLYAAKWEQTSAENGGSANLSWIDLGEGESDAVKALIDKVTQFSDIFETADMGDDGSCPEGFTASAANGVHECLKIKDGMDFAASHLETRRYAAIKGATTEIRKEEGITFDPDHHRLYVAISEISNGMEDVASKGKPSKKYDLASANDIKVDYNPCGGVYALDLDDDLVAKTMTAIITGAPQDLWGRQPVRRQHLRHGRAGQSRQHHLPARIRHADHRRGHGDRASKRCRLGLWPRRQDADPDRDDALRVRNHLRLHLPEHRGPRLSDERRACHVASAPPNYVDDGDLQTIYDFPSRRS